MGDADAARRGENIRGKRSLLLSPEQLRTIRAMAVSRIGALQTADKRPLGVQQEIQKLLPIYRSIVDEIDELDKR